MKQTEPTPAEEEDTDAGWEEDKWEDEDNWGDMNVRSPLPSFLLFFPSTSSPLCNNMVRRAPKGNIVNEGTLCVCAQDVVSETNKGEKEEASTGGGWEDDVDDWGSLEEPTQKQVGSCLRFAVV